MDKQDQLLKIMERILANDASDADLLLYNAWCNGLQIGEVKINKQQQKVRLKQLFNRISGEIDCIDMQ